METLKNREGEGEREREREREREKERNTKKQSGSFGLLESFFDHALINFLFSIDKDLICYYGSFSNASYILDISSLAKR